MTHVKKQQTGSPKIALGWVVKVSETCWVRSKLSSKPGRFWELHHNQWTHLFLCTLPSLWALDILCNLTALFPATTALLYSSWTKNTRSSCTLWSQLCFYCPLSLLMTEGYIGDRQLMISPCQEGPLWPAFLMMTYIPWYLPYNLSEFYGAPHLTGNFVTPPAIMNQPREMREVNHELRPAS